MKAVQVRNVPEPLHRRLKSQAAASGQSLSDYLLAERPTREEMGSCEIPLPSTVPSTSRWPRASRPRC